MTDPAVKKSMRANRSRDTRPELAVRSILHRRGLRYRVIARPLPDLRRTADLVFTRAKVAVFVDGCYWHGCPEHYRRPSSNVDYWVAKLERNQRRDQEVDAALRDAGWFVIRVWEHEDATDVADKIEVTVLTARDRGNPLPGVVRLATKTGTSA